MPDKTKRNTIQKRRNKVGAEKELRRKRMRRRLKQETEMRSISYRRKDKIALEEIEKIKQENNADGSFLDFLKG